MTYIRRRKSGTARIQRDSYNSKFGFDIKYSWFELSKQCKERANGTCEHCRVNKGKESHHIIPLSRGGLNSLSNLIYLCEDCHNRRHNHLFRSRRNGKSN